MRLQQSKGSYPNFTVSRSFKNVTDLRDWIRNGDAIVVKRDDPTVEYPDCNGLNGKLSILKERIIP